MLETRRKNLISIKDICLIGIMVAVIEVCKMTMSFLPNIELTSFWLIMFTLFLGKRVVFVVPVFIMLEGCVYGFGIWWVMYLYLWPLLVFITWIFRQQKSLWFWSIFSALFGLFFGLLSSFTYVVIGAAGDGLKSGIYSGFSWWISGIPWDITHGIGNFVLMLVLYKPVRRVMLQMKEKM